jgi:phosphatidyl-myo-inositol dimannoside synthase
VSRCLIVTNDFPPRQGGIETFVYELACRFPSDEVVVYTSSEAGAERFDANLSFPVVRDVARRLLPVRRVADRACELARAYRCDRVWFGAAAPLGLLAQRLRDTGVQQMVATTHGHEVWWARLPASRQALRRIADRVDTLTYLGSYTQAALAPAISKPAAARMARLTPGVDTSRFAPDVDASTIRTRYRLGGRPVILAVSRLVARKGQDMLIRALPAIRRAVPDAVMLLVGTGPDHARLRRLTARLELTDAVIFVGGVPHRHLPQFYAAADVFAIPCRTRLRGLEPEGLGIVFLEAAAAGLAVVAGDSGGAPEAVRHGETGYVVDSRSPRETAARLTELLTNSTAARAMGEKGRHWVHTEWTWDTSYQQLARMLDGTAPRHTPSLSGPPLGGIPKATGAGC